MPTLPSKEGVYILSDHACVNKGEGENLGTMLASSIMHVPVYANFLTIPPGVHNERKSKRGGVQHDHTFD